MFVPRHKLTIVYKSGAKVHTRADEFTVERKHGACSFVWTNMQPRPLLLGADDVVAVYEGHV